jgi:amino acid adenylation domain-containing protein
MDLVDRFHAQVARTPDADALVAAGTRLSYRELDERANRLAHLLRDHGVGPEMVVGQYLPRGPEAVTGLLAILKAGGAYLPLDPGHPAPRLSYLVDTAGARLILAEPGRHPDFGVAVVPPHAADTARTPDGPPDRVPAPDSLACVILTSGSTGRPKGIGLCDRSIANVADWALSRAPGPVVCAHICSLGFDVSLQEIFGTLLGGGRLVVGDEELRKDPYLLMDLLAQEAAQRLYTSPGFLHQLARAYLSRSARPALGELRQVIAAGERLRVTDDVRRFLAGVGAELENQYGPSETHQATANPLRGKASGWPEHPTLGRPIPNVRVRVLDGTLSEVPVGQPGEVYIGGRGVARGYVGQPALTAERFVPDRARWTADGELDFLGRLDNQVKVRGFRVEPSDVEAALAELPGVQEAVVVPRQEPDGQWRLDAYVVPARGQVPPDAVAARAFVAARLPDYMVPATVRALDSLPLNRNGKVDRPALPVAPPDGPRTAVPYVAPRSDQETVLCKLFGDVLGVRRVGVDDNFFDLGGNSLLATRVVTGVVGEFGVELLVRTVFDRPTVRQLAVAVEEALVERIRALGADGVRAAMASLEDA